MVATFLGAFCITNKDKITGMAMGNVLVDVVLALGLSTAKITNLSACDATTVAIETGVQNGTLGIAMGAILVGQFLGSSEGFSAFALPSAMYGIVMYLAVPFVL